MKIELADPEAAEAVALIDRGDARGLVAHLRDRPGLLAQVIDVGPEKAGGGYFAYPRLLWFVAENPIRTGRLRHDVLAVTEGIVAEMRQQGVATLAEDLDKTLGLVASGCVPRESGVQADLIACLVSQGANPTPALQPALAHREVAAARALVSAGADLTLEAAAGLGEIARLEERLAEATQEELQHGLSLAAANGQAEATRRLLAAGADPNRFNDPGYHGHTTPLHQAVWVGALETVKALIAAGADPGIVDRSFGGPALGWAHHAGQDDIAAYLRSL